VGGAQSINPSMPSLGTFWHPVTARPDRAEILVLPSINYDEVTGRAFLADVANG
jgi:hypothetical protein